MGGGWWDGVGLAEGSGEEDEVEKGGLAWSLTCSGVRGLSCSV